MSSLRRLKKIIRRMIYGSPEGKASAVTPFMVLTDQGQPAWTDVRYDKMSKEGYENCVVAYRCIDEISFNVASVPWQLWDYQMDGKEEIKEHEILNLLERPNPRQAWTSYAYAWAAYTLIAGNSYMEGVGPETGPNRGTFMELYNKRPDRMTVLKGKDGPSGYRYTINGRDIDPPNWQVDPKTGICDIHHWKLFHPRNDWYGMSPIQAAARDIDTHNGYGSWNYKLLKNEARPSGIIRYPTAIDKDKIKTLKDQFREKYQGFQARDFAGILILGEGGEWIQLGLSPKDMEFVQGRNISAKDICSAFKVPPLILNIGGDATFANMKEAKLWLWETTILFYLNFLRDELNHWLVPRWDERDQRNLYLDYNLDNTPMAQVAKDLAWERQEKGKGILTINERRKMVGYPEIGTEGDIILVSAAEIPLGMTGEESEEQEATKFVVGMLEEGYSEENVTKLLKSAFPRFAGNGKAIALVTRAIEWTTASKDVKHPRS